MQVKKFEAKTIKDAIELVKRELGPDAIILSAKENNRGFGLMGETSVEVTAAVSENRLVKKQLAEKKLDSKSKVMYQHAPAKIQKEFIDKSYQVARDEFDAAEEAAETKMTAQTAKVNAQREAIKAAARPTGVRYADILDEGVSTQSTNVDGIERTTTPSIQAVTKAMNANFNQNKNQVPAVNERASSPAEAGKIASLQNEIQYLRTLLENFQKVPQNFLSLHPGAEEGLPFELSFTFKKLEAAGISQANIIEMLKIGNEVIPSEHKKKRAFVDGWAIKYLLEHTDVVSKPFQGKYHVFLGSTGQGKTSMVVKLACYLLLKAKKRVAILSGDTTKVGAPDQMRIYCQILNIPYATIRSAQDWVALEPHLRNIDYVLLDTPGVTLKGTKDLDHLRSVLPVNMDGVQTHFVQSAMARDADAFEVAERFKIIGFKDVIFTRLDEAVQHGIIYNFQKHFKTPLHSFGIGNSIPEDFELATKERVVDLLFGLSKIKKERGTP